MVRVLLLLSFWNLFVSSEAENAKISIKTTAKFNNITSSNVAVHTDSLTYYSEKFSRLVALIRDGKIEKQTAKREAGVLLAQLKRQYKRHTASSKTFQKVFPIEGYSANAIGGTKGEGYKPGYYNFYDGNLHTGHPAHDIFIRDKDQNCLDDRTGKPVNIVSLSKGIAVATEPAWQLTSNLRGGIYVMVYNQDEELLYYYAHNNKLNVKPGTLVKPGDKLAELGRSGLNAYKARSPTHLHLMALKIKPEGNLAPIDLYPVLKVIK